MKRKLKKILSFTMILCMIFVSVSGCASKHLEMHYEDNQNVDISSWDDVVNESSDTWDTVEVVSWDEVDDYSDWVYATILFEDIAEECPIVECQVLDYSNNGVYFDGEKVYELVNDEFDVNSFVAKYAAGTGVIVICVILNVIVSVTNMPQTVVCMIAGAADSAISYSTKGAAFNAAMKAVSEAIVSGGDIESVLYSALEGSADGYMWGAIYGAAQGGIASKYCFTGDTLIHMSTGVKEISKVQCGDYVYAYDVEKCLFDYKMVTQVQKNCTDELVAITIEGGEIIRATPRHPFISEHGVVYADEIKAGDTLSTDKGATIVENVSVIKLDKDVITYNLCVEDVHTYLVGEAGVIVHNRCNPNEKYAGTYRKFEEGTELAKKYPEGVYIKINGYPDFAKYADKIVKFDFPTKEGVDAGTCLRGDCYYDFILANKAAGFGNSVNDTPKGWTWHHNEDGRTMELVPTDLHRAIGHDGGEKIIKLILGLS